MYRIIRVTDEGYLKDIGYRSYKKYLEVEQVIKGLKKTYPKRVFTIIQTV
jgi:hypothetical protein|tara:strand:- start:23970 stop:24119 length:150 start_codon:yes stop_codon:yes gene_type:complete